MRRIAQVSVLIIAVGAGALVAHWPVLSAQAMTFDDSSYLTDNPLTQKPSWASASRFFGEVLKPSTVQGYYHPLSMLSLMFDCAAGAREGNLYPIHRTSLALHVLNAALIVVLVYLLFGQPWVAALVGLLFGVHPITVESVAWIAERKVVLATFFFLWALIFYVAFARGRRWGYWAALGAYLLALLAKPTTTPLPILLLLLDYWPLRRWTWRRVVEKWPFFLLSVIFGVVTYISQARAAFVETPIAQGPARFFLTPCYNIVFYLAKFVWPGELTSFYDFPKQMTLAQPGLLIGVIGTAVLLAALALSLRWTRAAVIGWLFFFVAVLPTIGIVGFTNTIAAMRHFYIPVLGFLLILAAALGRAWLGWPPKLPATWCRAGVVAVMLLAAALAGGATHRLAEQWRNTETLYRYELQFAPEAPPLLNDLGIELSHQKRYDEALGLLTKAIAGGGITEPYARYNLGLSLASMGREDEAAKQYAAALQRNPNLVSAHQALGQLLLKGGQFVPAAAHFQEVLRLKPEQTAVCHPLAQALARQGQLDAALPYLERSLAVDPDSAELQMDLGNVLAMKGAWGAARQHYEKALQLQPDLLDARNNLGSAWLKLGAPEKAADAFREAIRLRPDVAYAYKQLGEILVEQGRAAEAVEVLEAAVQHIPDDADLKDRLDKARAPREPGAES